MKWLRRRLKRRRLEAKGIPMYPMEAQRRIAEATGLHRKDLTWEAFADWCEAMALMAKHRLGRRDAKDVLQQLAAAIESREAR